MQQIRFHQQQVQSPNTSSNTKPVMPLLHQQVLLTPLPYMLRMALQPWSREIKLTSDRLDAFANALISLIVLDQAQFHRIVSEFIQGQIGSVQIVLIKQIQSLCSDRNVNMNSIEKKNRQLFVNNFREFINHVRSLPLR